MQTAWVRINNNTELSANQLGDALDTVIASLKARGGISMDSPRNRGNDVCVRCVSLPDDSSIYDLVKAFDASLKARGIKTISQIWSSEPPPMKMVSNEPVPQAIVELTQG